VGADKRRQDFEAGIGSDNDFWTRPDHEVDAFEACPLTGEVTVMDALLYLRGAVSK
jgi:hypothetical protein